MRKIICYIWFIFPFLFSSCEKERIIETPESKSSYVVEGWIEQGKYPIVYLSRSTSFFSEIDSADLFGLMVHQAKITVSDGTESEILTLRKNVNHYPIYYYEGTELKGETGKTYDLKIEITGQVITASTTIPPAPEFDSIWSHDYNDTAAYIDVSYTDNAATKDYYRTFIKILGQDEEYMPTYLNTFDDQYFSGRNVVLGLYRGSYGLSDMYNYNKYFNKGDIVIVRFCRTDKEHYDFWMSYYGKILNIASFSPSTSRIISNVNGALGVWGGYGASYYRIVIE